MNNYVQPGEILELTTPAAVTKGLGYKIGSIVGLATVSAGSGVKANFLVKGVALVVKATGGSSAWTEGVKLYWDDSAKKFTKTSSGNTLVGVAVAAAGDNDATGYVRLDGAAR